MSTILSSEKKQAIILNLLYFFFAVAPKRVKVIVCKVCGDKSSGINYGVITCQQCKAFFQRSDDSAVENYFCLSEKKCEISLVTRSLCNYCRFQKCLSRGMSKDGKQICIKIFK